MFSMQTSRALDHLDIILVFILYITCDLQLSHLFGTLGITIHTKHLYYLSRRSNKHFGLVQLSLLCSYKQASLIKIHECSYSYILDIIIPSMACLSIIIGTSMLLSEGQTSLFFYNMNNYLTSSIFMVPFFKHEQAFFYRKDGHVS